MYSIHFIHTMSHYDKVSFNGRGEKQHGMYGIYLKMLLNVSGHHWVILIPWVLELIFQFVLQLFFVHQSEPFWSPVCRIFKYNIKIKINNFLNAQILFLAALYLHCTMPVLGWKYEKSFYIKMWFKNSIFT